MWIVWLLAYVLHRAKNHISAEDPYYFAIFYYNGFQISEAKFIISLQLSVNLLEINCIKGRYYKRFKIWLPGEIWFFAPFSSLFDSCLTTDWPIMTVTIGVYLEDLIMKCGGFGRFQILLVLILFSSTISVTWTMLMMAFAGVEPDWWCDDYHGNDTTTSLRSCSVRNSTGCSNFRYDDSMNTVISEVREKRRWENWKSYIQSQEFTNLYSN